MERPKFLALAACDRMAVYLYAREFLNGFSSFHQTALQRACDEIVTEVTLVYEALKMTK